jgi:hypothetical protein
MQGFDGLLGRLMRRETRPFVAIRPGRILRLFHVPKRLSQPISAAIKHAFPYPNHSVVKTFCQNPLSISAQCPPPRDYLDRIIELETGRDDRCARPIAGEVRQSSAFHFPLPSPLP